MPYKGENRINDEIFIADLYPDLSPAEQEEAEERLLRYLTVVERIYERIGKESPELLTELESLAMLRAGGSDESERR